MSTPNITAPNPAPGPSTPSMTPEELAQAKVSEAVEKQLAFSLKGGTGQKKRKAQDADDDDTAAGTYRWYGRNMARSIGPFIRVFAIVQHGVKLGLQDSDDEAPEQNEEEQRMSKSWNIMTNTIPGFAEQMIGLGGNNALRKQVCSEIQQGIRGARGDDSGSLKPVICDYIDPPAKPATPPSATASSVTPPSASATAPPETETAETAPIQPVTRIAPRGTKADRGFNNPKTARLLCPVKYPATEETFADIRGGKEIYGTEIPYFMYRDGMVVDLEDMDEGLLESHIMFATAKHIYQGPSAALEGPGFTRGKAGNAALNGVMGLTDRDIGYIASQVRFGVSSQNSWTGQDKDFNYSDFFWCIVKALGGDEGQEIINRFNYAVFGTTPSARKSAVAEATPKSDFEILEEQRAAKRARKIAAAAAAAAPTDAPPPDTTRTDAATTSTTEGS